MFKSYITSKCGKEMTKSRGGIANFVASAILSIENNKKYPFVSWMS